MEGGAASPGAGGSGPHDQGRMGTCAVHALITVVAQRLMKKYGVVLDEKAAIAAVVLVSAAHAGSSAVGVIADVHAQGDRLKLATMGDEPLLTSYRGRLFRYGAKLAGR